MSPGNADAHRRMMQALLAQSPRPGLDDATLRRDLLRHGYTTAVWMRGILETDLAETIADLAHYTERLVAHDETWLAEKQEQQEQQRAAEDREQEFIHVSRGVMLALGNLLRATDDDQASTLLVKRQTQMFFIASTFLEEHDFDWWDAWDELDALRDGTTQQISYPAVCQQLARNLLFAKMP